MDLKNTKNFGVKNWIHLKGILTTKVRKESEPFRSSENRRNGIVRSSLSGISNIQLKLYGERTQIIASFQVVHEAKMEGRLGGQRSSLKTLRP